MKYIYIDNVRLGLVAENYSPGLTGSTLKVFGGWVVEGDISVALCPNLSLSS